MIILSAAGEELRVVLDGVVTANQLPIVASFIDVSSSVYEPNEVETTTNSATPVTVVSQPTYDARHIKYLSVYNEDTANRIVTVIKYASSTSYTLAKISLTPGETLQYADGEGFSVMRTDGAVKTTPAPNFAISAGTQSASTGTISFANSNGVSIGMSGSSLITASVDPYLTQSFFAPRWAEFNAFACPTSSGTNTINLSLQRVFVPYYMTATRLDLLGHLTVAGSTTGSMTGWAGVYTRNSNQLSNVSSTSTSVAWSTAGNVTISTQYVGQSGTRWRPFTNITWNFTPGEYWFGFFMSVAGVAATTGSLTLFGQSSQSILGMPGGNNDTIGLMGVYSAATGAFPATIGMTNEILYCHSSASISASVPLRQPYFRMMGTF